MHITNLRKVGGSVMLAVPPAILELLQLSAGVTVGVSVDNGRLVVEPQPRPRYTLAELLAGSDFTGNRSAGEQAWVDSAPVGRELI
ncbi:MAG: antitoxin [Acetobacteraceae bacterium]|nr:antitoxin [Acetobacteraceae bacterium]